MLGDFLVGLEMIKQDPGFEKEKNGCVLSIIIGLVIGGLGYLVYKCFLGGS